MSVQGEIELQSDRKLQDQPVIGTQILDGNMPSQINFEGLKNGKIKNKGSDIEKNMNPEQISLPEYKDGIIVLKQFNVRGKGIFDVQTKYKQDDVIPVKDKKFIVKALNCQGNRGLLNIWQSMLGYSKKQLIIEDGQVYVTQLIKNQNILQRAYKLTNLIKIFVDPEQKSLRLVFKSENVPKKRIARDFQTEQLACIMQKLLLQCNVIGLDVIPDDF